MTAARIAKLLKGTRAAGGGWTCLCPAHDDHNPSLFIHERNGRIVYHCRAGCTSDEVAAAIKKLGVRPNAKDVSLRSVTGPARAMAQQSGLTVAEFSKAKGLPVDFLNKYGVVDGEYFGKPAVVFAYRSSDGDLSALRYRICLDGRDKFRWKKGDKTGLYGLYELEQAREDGFEHVAIVEGESDTLTLWCNKFPAVGLPGASLWREDRDAGYFDGFKEIYVVIEPDAGGVAVKKWLATSKIRDRAHLVSLGDFKDPSEMFLDNPARFKKRWRKALENSIAWTDVEVASDKAARLAAWKVCKELAEEGEILNEFARDLKRCGLVGERTNAKLIFLALCSRFFPRPISIVVKGPSSGGKSFLVETVLRFFPPAAWHALSAMSEKALVYSKEPLEHRFLVVYEATGMSGEFASYAIRTLLSEGKLRYETVQKASDGQHQAKLIEREGPTGLLVTTTGVTLHPENETRLLSLTVVDTPEQTGAVMRSLASGKKPKAKLFERWHEFQNWLSLKPHAVNVPFAAILADLIPPVAVRLRRDFRAILSLIEVHALVHQWSRDKYDDGEIVADLEDYRAVRKLVAKIVAVGIEATVSGTVRETVEAVRDLKKDDTGVSVAALAKHLKLDKSTTSRRAKVALQRGYLKNGETRKGFPAQYFVDDPMPEDLDILPTADALEAAVAAAESAAKKGE